jgi:hypothetical protein
MQRRKCARRVGHQRAGDLPQTGATLPPEPKKIFFGYDLRRKNEWIVSFDFPDNRYAGIGRKGAWGLS